MGLLVVRLPVDWACLHVFSTTGRVVMQVSSEQAAAGCTTVGCWEPGLRWHS
jgi:hypothetical protein